jgi:hypothetical protein
MSSLLLGQGTIRYIAGEPTIFCETNPRRGHVHLKKGEFLRGDLNLLAGRIGGFA